MTKEKIFVLQLKKKNGVMNEFNMMNYSDCGDLKKDLDELSPGESILFTGKGVLKRLQ